MKKKSRLTERCPKCKHDHVAMSGPCLKLGCGCHYLYDQDRPAREAALKESLRKKKEKK